MLSFITFPAYVIIIAVKKHRISHLFLYRQRFRIGYILLGIAFTALVFGLPLLSPRGLSAEEMQSVITTSSLASDNFSFSSLIDLLYRALQHLSLRLFGLTPYAIKLPSIVFGLILGVLLALLLSRWFKTRVALITAALLTLGTPFLYLAGSGTPLIMLPFFIVLILWLGSKLHGRRPHALLTFLFLLSLAASLFTPLVPYFTFPFLIYLIFSPHFRFVIRSQPLPLLVLSILILTSAAIGVIVLSIFFGSPLRPLFLPEGFSFVNFEANIDLAFKPFLTWNSAIESPILSPIFGLPILALSLVGFITTSQRLFSTRSGLAVLLFIFVILLSGFNPRAVLLLVLPIAILAAYGIKYLLEKWYGLFPENPYARIFALLPISIFLGIVTVGSLTHYVFGYRYTLAVAQSFSSDLHLINQHLKPDQTLFVRAGTLNYDFYRNFSHYRGPKVTSNLPSLAETASFAALGHINLPEDSKYKLERIITSPKTLNSDRIYLYSSN